MKVVYEYSHLGGAEILQMRYPGCNREIYEIIAEVTARRVKLSEEKTMPGKELYAPKDMNRQFREAFAGRGYCELRDTYTITIPNSSVTIFNENKADVGVEVVPCHALHKQMSTGVSYGEQLVYDIERLKRHFPAVPVKVILINVDESS
jgi:hypothetical protein